MKKILTFFIIFSCFLLKSTFVLSQGFLSAHIGAALPLFKFGDKNFAQDASAGGAAVGIDIGAKFEYPITKKGINIFVGADIIYNGLKKDIKNNMQLIINNTYGAGADIKYISYFNMPVLVGANYKFYSIKDFDFSGEFGIGIDLFKIKRLKIESGEIKYKERYDFSTKLAIKAGANITFKDKYIFGINYMMLGKHQVKGEQIMLGTSIDFERESQNVNVFTLTLGYRF
jgi:hypothetical protein